MLIAHDPEDTTVRPCSTPIVSEQIVCQPAELLQWLTSSPGRPAKEGLCVQARWVAQVLSGKATLPSEAAMLEDIRSFYTLRAEHGVPIRYTHCQVSL